MGARHKHVVMVAMVFAVAMMFIDQTIVVLAIPQLPASVPIQGGTAGIPTGIAHDVALGLAHATHTVVLLMAVVMAAAFVTAVITMPRTRTAAAPEPSTPE